MKKKYTRLNHKIYCTTFLIKKITPNWEKITTNGIMKYFTPHFYFKKAIPYSEKITRKTKNFTRNNKPFKPNPFFSSKHRSSHPDVFLEKGVLKICSKFTEEQPCRNVISITLLCNFIEIALWHVFSPVNLLHIFRTTFSKNTSRWLLLKSKQF